MLVTQIAIEFCQVEEMCLCPCRHDMRWLHLAAQLGFPVDSPDAPRIPWDDDEVMTFGPEGTWYHRAFTQDAGAYAPALCTLYRQGEAQRIFAELAACRCCARHQLQRPLVLG
jgi:hypothetical protein